MITQDIIDEISKMAVTSSKDYDQFDRIYELTEQLKQNTDGQLACEALIGLIERHPGIEFGKPGEPVHTLEDYEGYYEDLLIQSLDRQPTYITVWMLNRIINTETDKQKLIDKMESFITHPLADEQTKMGAAEFYKYQMENK